MVGLTRASLFAIKKETTSGEYAPPTSGADFVALRPGNEITYEPEKLESDELLNDIGASKSFIGKELVSGSHSAYLRHSGVEGQAPQLGPFWESLLGSVHVVGTERATIVGSTEKILKVAAGQGVEFVQGQGLLIKSAAGYQIRNVASVVGDDLYLNFALPSVPAIGTLLGKAITYVPVPSGHPAVSTTKYLGNDVGIEAAVGDQITEASITATANGLGEVEFSYEGIRYLYNPMIVDATNKFLDFTDSVGAKSITLQEGVYKTPIELAETIQALMETASLDVITCVYSNTTGKYTITGALELNWQSGANSANSIGELIGFDTAADSDAGGPYTSEDPLDFKAPFAPIFDGADPVIIKGVDLFIGGVDDNLCVCAQEIQLTFSKETEDVDCACEPNGVSEKIATTRAVEMTTTVSVKKNDVSLLDALMKNKGLSAMFNAGPKLGGNWKPGTAVNFYLQNSTVTSYSTTGDSFIQASITLTGFVSSTGKDGYINFL